MSNNNSEKELVLQRMYRRSRKRLKVEAAKKGMTIPELLDKLV
jgi:hypothetical protein